MLTTFMSFLNKSTFISEAFVDVDVPYHTDNFVGFLNVNEEGQFFFFKHILCFLLLFFGVEFYSTSVFNHFGPILECELLPKFGHLFQSSMKMGGVFSFVVSSASWVFPFFV